MITAVTWVTGESTTLRHWLDHCLTLGVTRALVFLARDDRKALEAVRNVIERHPSTVYFVAVNRQTIYDMQSGDCELIRRHAIALCEDDDWLLVAPVTDFLQCQFRLKSMIHAMESRGYTSLVASGIDRVHWSGNLVAVDPLGSIFHQFAFEVKYGGPAVNVIVRAKILFKEGQPLARPWITVHRFRFTAEQSLENHENWPTTGLERAALIQLLCRTNGKAPTSGMEKSWIPY